MKKPLNFTLITILSIGLMVACGSDDTNEEENNEEQTNESNELDNNDEQENAVNENVNEEDTVNETTENEGNTSGNNEVSGDYDDQEDLRLGDSGKMSTTIGEFEVSFSNPEIFTELDGEGSSLDKIVTVNISVTNLGESEIEADSVSEDFVLSHSKGDGGYSDVSGSVESVESFKGTIGPSETLEGQMVFDVLDSEEYFIFVVEGLIASGVASNNLLWTFDKSEAE